MVKVLARIKKAIRKKMQSMIRRRRKIRKTFNAITVRSGDTMHLNVDQRGYQGANMKFNLLKMRILILKKYS